MNHSCSDLAKAMGAFVVAFHFASGALAATTAYASFAGGNVCSTPSGDGTCFADLASTTMTNGSAADTGSVTRTFSGLDSTGAVATGSIGGRAWSQATSTSLRSYATAKFDNPILNANNAPLITGGYSSPPVIHTGGIPTAVDSYAVAYTADTVTISGGPVSYVQLTLSISGVIATDAYPPAWSQASVFQNTGSSAFSGGSLLYNEYHDGVFNATLTTNPIPVVGGVFAFGLGLYTEVDIDLRNRPASEHGTFAGSVDYTHTLTLLGVSGFTSGGDAVAIASAIGQSGTSYPISPVPESGTASLLLVGMTFLLAAVGGKKARVGKAWSARPA